MTNRTNVDMKIRELWLALKQLDEDKKERGMRYYDIDLFYEITKHPTIQSVLETARKFENE